MCGRFTLKTPEATIASLFPDLSVPALAPRYNVAPTQNVAAVRQAASGDLEFVALRWGLVPFWAKELSVGARMINARSETVREKPSFRTAFKKRRCLVFADGYFEWKKIGKKKQPYYMTTQENGGGFCMAGLWESWTDNSTNQNVETCTVLTTDACPSLVSVHDRMPVVLPNQEFEFWLDPDFNDGDRIHAICQPTRDDFFEVQTVNPIVNNARNDSPECVEIIDAPKP